MRIPLATVLILCSGVAALLSAPVRADGDEPPLYVGSGGTDSGNCQNVVKACRSLDYALKRVGKHGRINVGAGMFSVGAAENVVYMLSGAIDVRGGYPLGAKTTLTGVPHEFAAALGAKGFRVIADTKGAGETPGASIYQVQQLVHKSTAATACVSGFAGVYPCNNVDLLAHVSDRTPAARGADIWGFMDLNTNREYAVVGYSSGTAIYDVTDAENPREVGFIDGQSSIWRDIKVHQFWNSTTARWHAYAYVTSENVSDGLYIIDLGQLPHSISRVSYNSDFSSAHNVYLNDTDFSTGLSISGNAPTLILAGSNRSDGRFRSYSLADPAAPSFIASPATPAGQSGSDRLYMHDAASMLLSDSRKDSQCVNAAASPMCHVLFDFNESSFDIWDLTNAANPARLSQTFYASSGYVHSGWWSEDQQFLFVQDELDERDQGIPATTLRVFSIADLTAPILVGTWTGPSNAIDHNGFVRGNRYYMSNYTRGLSILDISNASSPQSVGRFDTYPASDSVGFPGNWGAYPFFPSGNIALSDIDSGFYMVADGTLNVAEGTFSFAASAFGGDEAQGLGFVVQRTGGSQGAASVSWQLMAATGSLNDVSSTGGTLTWADGDASDRVVNLGPVNDGNAEGLERLLLKLSAPTGGASLSAPSIASAYISDPGTATTLAFMDTDVAVAERGFGMAIAVIQRSGSATGAVSIDFSITSGDATATSDYVGPANGTLSWADGDADPKVIEYTIVDDGSSESDEFILLTLGNTVGGSIGADNQLRIDILDGSGSNSAPNAVAGMSQTVSGGVTVTLNGSGSNDPDGDSLTFIWSQALGPTVTLSASNSATATFPAPSVSSDTLLQFQLQVTDVSGLSNTSTTNVTVAAAPSAGGGGGGGNGGGSLDPVALLVLLCASLLAARRKDAIEQSFAHDRDRLK
jgi:choice-of-anchor B domain-containing protein